MKLGIKMNLLAICLLLGWQCKKENIREPLFIIESTATMTIPAGLNTVETHYFVVNDIPSTLGAQLESRNLSISDIQTIKPRQIKLTALDNQSEFNFIEWATVDIHQYGNESFREIAYLEFIPFNTKSELNLFPSLLDVKEYLEPTTYFIEVGINPRSFIANSFDVRIDLAFQAE